MSNTEKPWFIIQCTSGQENQSERCLDRMGYPDGWHPTEKKRTPEAVYQRLLKAIKKLPPWAQTRKPARYQIKTIVTGYLFLPAEDIKVHEINGHHGPQIWMRVLCVNGKPYRLSNDQMAKMKETPKLAQDIVDQAKAAERAAWEAKQPKVGEEACVMDGLFKGKCGTVLSHEGGQVEIEGLSSIGRVKVSADIVQRAA